MSEETVQGILDGLGGVKDFALSSSFILPIAAIIVLVIASKYLKGMAANRDEINQEVERQMADFYKKLEEQGYDSDGNPIAPVLPEDLSDEELEEWEHRKRLETSNMRAASTERNSRIKTRVSSRHKYKE